MFSFLAYPVDHVVDPTGAGDTFVGVLMGYLSKVNKTDEKSLRKALLYATMLASFNVQGFGMAKTAFAYPAGRGNLAHVKLLRPIITASSSVQLQLGIDIDYDESSLNTGSAISYSQAVAKWDVALWDQAYWSSGNSTIAKWRSVSHKPGRALSLRLRLAGKGITMTWIATDLILQKGGLF
jgi:hypothetical protein